jgi:acyl-coenzyme A thioesterase PaaI-like protein
MCLVCGLKNGYGLKAAFYELEEGELVALFTPGDEHQGYPGRLHGGIAMGILDETIGRAIMINHEQDSWAVTVEFSAKLRKAIPLGVELKVVGRITSESRRLFRGSGELLLPDGDVAVTGAGTYMKLPLSRIADADAMAEEWAVVPNEQDPLTVTLQR